MLNQEQKAALVPDEHRRGRQVSGMQRLDSTLGDSLTTIDRRSEVPAGDVFAVREEHTLAGRTIGLVRDLFGDARSEEDRRKKAESNDFVATIAADTAAMMLKAPALAGLVRATLLADLQGDARDLALSFAKDTLEGVGLNYIGKRARSPAKIPLAASQELSATLGQEVRFNAGSGLMFGLVKAGSDPSGWHDENGHFSFQSGLKTVTDWQKLSTAALTGAALSVPAGMIGVRIAERSALSLAEHTGSQTLAAISGGVLSGASGGAIFGGLDAVAHGKSLAEIGAQSFEGMLNRCRHRRYHIERYSLAPFCTTSGASRCTRTSTT